MLDIGLCLSVVLRLIWLIAIWGLLYFIIHFCVTYTSGTIVFQIGVSLWVQFLTKVGFPSFYDLGLYFMYNPKSYLSIFHHFSHFHIWIFSTSTGQFLSLAALWMLGRMLAGGVGHGLVVESAHPNSTFGSLGCKLYI